ncbi:tetratricopeptide repeat protein [Agaribacterium sp. ZY112]|uniref:tetratricopeptide repeat protein n=1 Tax=Agaribacterium sp. ZY112 TaxID=3233574 RepID=UPI0035258AA5
MNFNKLITICLAVALMASCATQDASKELDVEPDSDVLIDTFTAIAKPENPEAVSAPSSVKRDFKVVKEAMVEGKWAEAQASLQAMLVDHPQLAGLYTNLAITYSEQGELGEAEKAYKQALLVNPYQFDAYSNLGLLLRQQGRFDEAESTYLEALALWPHHQASLINLGVLYDLYMGKPKLALPYFELAQKLNGDEPDRQLRTWIADVSRRAEVQQ